MWNPDVYMKFSDLRTRPALELASRCGVVEDGLIYDLGCGPGNSAQILHALNPGARIIGVDSSPEMLERARAEGPRGAQWTLADLETWEADEAADIIFSNAARINTESSTIATFINFLFTLGSIIRLTMF